jgi:sensor c-di-GMP phosphodiesterase-like protein
LIEFVELEKQRLQQSEKALNDLKNEEQLLKPIVQSDRKTVEALLELQNQRAQETLTKERWYAFGFGILTSLIASFLIAVGRFAYKYSNRKNATKKPEPVIEPK